MKPIILASQSPRRKQLLELAGLSFEVIPANIDETAFSQLAPENAVLSSAKAKAQSIAVQYPDRWIIAADTIVVIDNQILGKPTSKENAREMLKRLSDRMHQVFTGFTISSKNENKTFYDIVKTDVCFKQLRDNEIEWYLQTNEPYDKAGAYAIQGIGAFMVRTIDGSYTNVVGLPVCEVIELLIQNKIIDRKIDEH